jgi:phospholipase/carboxylesterase
MNAQKHQKNIVSAGEAIKPESKVLIMIHGRGGSAEDILSLASHLDVKDFALRAPQATGNSWYPYSFLAPQAQNEPWLSSALDLISQMTTELEAQGIRSENIYFLGFSQGACLTLEFVTRHARRWGGVVAFTGGLIGDAVNTANYRGDFKGTPVFIGTSNPDPHVPLQRVDETVNIMKGMGADLTLKVYPGMGHTINGDEIALANQIVFHQGVL